MINALTFYAVMDPRTKLKWYSCNDFHESFIKTCKSLVKKVWNEKYKPASNTELEEEVQFCDQLFQSQMKRAKIDSRDELQSYLAEKVIPASNLPNGPLQYWKARPGVDLC